MFWCYRTHRIATRINFFNRPQELAIQRAYTNYLSIQTTENIMGRYNFVNLFRNYP